MNIDNGEGFATKGLSKVPEGILESTDPVLGAVLSRGRFVESRFVVFEKSFKNFENSSDSAATLTGA